MKDCVSLEVAQKLQKAGYKSKCRYYWTEDLKNNNWDIKKGGNKNLMTEYFDKTFGHRVLYLAPTATQLAEELPKRLPVYHGEDEICNLTIGWKELEQLWLVQYIWWDGARNPVYTYSERSKRLPDALGLMMVYLLENNLIKK